MKRNMLSIALVIFISQVLQAQEQTFYVDFPAMATSRNLSTFSNSIFLKDTSYTPEYYLQKSKNQQTAAWFMLGGGIAMSIIGVVGVSQNIFGNDNAANTYGVVTLMGVGLSLGTIPVFIASGHNARKAATLSFKNQPILLPQQNSFVFKSQPAISLTIPL